MSNKIYPIGIQNFEKIRKDGYFYIDKTAWVYQLAKTGSYYFSQPSAPFRQKSSDLHLRGLLSGEKGIVQGAGHRETRRKTGRSIRYLHLDLNIGNGMIRPIALGNILETNHLDRMGESLYGARCRPNVTFSLRFAGIIKRACEQTGQRAVILVDAIRQTDAPGHRQRGTAKRNTATR